MGAAERVELPIVGSDGRARGTFAIQLLPTARVANFPPPLLDLRSAPERDPALEAIQLLEGTEYRFEIEADGVQPVVCDRPEILQPDTRSGRTGRLRTGLRTGTLPLRLFLGGDSIGEVVLEVRSRKLDYLEQYRWMLRDLAEVMAEVVMERFGATEQRFRAGAAGDARTLYQKFAFLKSLLDDDAFQAALRRIVHRPHASWTEDETEQSPRRGLRSSGAIVRQLARPGPRRAVADAPSPHVLAAWHGHLPLILRVARTEETLDTGPNRFVKFALTRWREDVTRVLNALKAEPASAPVRRGIGEVMSVLVLLEETLAAPVFEEVGELTQLPVGNPVLLRREGYREVYRAFLQSSLSSQLAWVGGEDVYGAGQRDVAALYEYWAFLQLAVAVSRVCDQEFDLSSLLEVRDDGLGLGLKRGRQVMLRGWMKRLGRSIRIELWFNRTFSSAGLTRDSWSRSMRPDCSLRLHCETGALESSEDVWLHFDAKYRVDELQELFGQNAVDQVFEVDDSADTSGDRAARREDLLKMHAYRDAIRRSAGAYVLYPGDSEEQCREFHELLPGLGAFGLRPSHTGEALGSENLRRFLDSAVTHFASQTTQDERGRFWRRISYGGQDKSVVRAPAASFLEKPPADTQVLLGYVRGPKHWDWIGRHSLYNLRADDRPGRVPVHGRELAAELLILAGPGRERGAIFRVAGPVLIRSREQLLALGYPTPRGRLYFCLPLEAVEASMWSEQLYRSALEDARSLLGIGRSRKAPLATTWLALINALSG